MARRHARVPREAAAGVQRALTSACVATRRPAMTPRTATRRRRAVAQLVAARLPQPRARRRSTCPPRGSRSSATTATARRTCSRRSTTCSCCARCAARATQDLVRFGAAGFHIARRRRPAGACRRDRRRLRASGQAKKRVTLDGVEPPRLSDALGALPSVMFSPRDVELVAGRAERAAPVSRRRARADVAPLPRRRSSTTARALARRNAALRDAARAAARSRAARRRVGAARSPSTARVLWRERVAWVERARRTIRASSARRSASAARVAMRYATALEPAATDVPTCADALAAALASASAAATCGAGSRTPARIATTSTLTLDGARSARVRLRRPAAHRGDRAAPARGRDAARAVGARAARSCSTIRSPSSTRAARARILELLAEQRAGSDHPRRAARRATFRRS